MITTETNNPYTISYTTSDYDPIANKLIQAIVTIAQTKVEAGHHASVISDTSKYFRKLLRDYLLTEEDKE